MLRLIPAAHCLPCAVQSRMEHFTWKLKPENHLGVSEMHPVRALLGCFWVVVDVG